LLLHIICYKHKKRERERDDDPSSWGRFDEGPFCGGGTDTKSAKPPRGEKRRRDTQQQRVFFLLKNIFVVVDFAGFCGETTTRKAATTSFSKKSRFGKSG
jgi:hypothetical protein